MIWVENQDLNKLDMDVEDAKKISVKFALCDFKMKSDVIKQKKENYENKNSIIKSTTTCTCNPN